MSGDFGKEVGQVYRGIKKTVEEMPVQRDTPTGPAGVAGMACAVLLYAVMTEPTVFGAFAMISLLVAVL